MADLKIVENDVHTLRKQLDDIHKSLNINDNKDMDPTRENVGHGGMCQALSDFNTQVSDTKTKYTKKTENLISFLDEVSTGSSEVDAKIESGLSVD